VSDHPDQTEPDAPDTDASRERPVYRDAEEFNKALDAASESIRKAAGPDVVGNTIWWGVLALQAALYGSSLAFDWNIRHTLIPGVDLVKPVWVIIVGMVVYHHVWTRQRHRTILKRRMCFECGRSLVDVKTDDDGTGACPKCGHAFNLGQYRRPEENRGRAFRGYLDGDHFDKAMYAVAEDLKKHRGVALEGDALGIAWITLGVCFGLDVVLDWDMLDWIPGPQPTIGIWFIAMLIWSGWYAMRVKALRPDIVKNRLCFDCGFSLLGTETNEHGVGRCPECGGKFVLAQYERPEDPDGEDDADGEEGEEGTEGQRD
jgi:DNA-directed RNA polymerase subunit RPC12/RpoP